MEPNDFDDREVEWEIDVLIQMVGRAVYERLDPMDPAQQRFFEWLAREARLRQSGAERRDTERAATAFIERLRKRRVADRSAKRGQRTAIAAAPPRARLTAIDEPPPCRCLTADEAPPMFGSLRERVPAPVWDLAVAAGVGRELWDEPATSVVEVPSDVGDGRFVALAVAGDSMEPLLHTGDTILIRLGADVAADDVIVARHPEHGHVVKRVDRIDAVRIGLASLNAAYEPLEIPNDSTLIVGTVVVRWCPHEREHREH
jgi:SOS-response transcriptional repressor LexA